MAKFLYKKSYQLNNLKPIKYDDLLGKRGIFSTIRIIGKKPKFILLKSHMNNINSSLNKLNINFTLTDKIVLELIKKGVNKIKQNDNLLRIAISSNKISLSLRPRLRPNKQFTAILSYYKRPIPYMKNLYYKKIISFLNSINSQSEEIILCNKGLLLEGCTTNILCVHNKTIYIPLKNYYKGITMQYLLFKSKRKIMKTNISINSLNKFQEIFLVGSGKGVVQLSSIPQINWKSKSNLVCKEFQNLYKKIL